MKQDAYFKLTGAIFLVIAVIHAARLFRSWPVSIGGWSVPLWISGVGLVVAAYLAYTGLNYSRSKK